MLTKKKAILLDKIGRYPYKDQKNDGGNLYSLREWGYVVKAPKPDRRHGMKWMMTGKGHTALKKHIKKECNKLPAKPDTDKKNYFLFTPLALRDK